MIFISELRKYSTLDGYLMSLCVSIYRSAVYTSLPSSLLQIQTFAEVLVLVFGLPFLEFNRARLTAEFIIPQP